MKSINEVASRYKSHFALCESCFWSASVIRSDSLREGSQCPVCNHAQLALMPIQADEAYRVELSSSRGVEVSFSRREANYLVYPS